MQKRDFMALSREQILALINTFQLPKLGVFVPDGSRRLALAYGTSDIKSEEFQEESAVLPARYLKGAIQTFFDYGLPTLMVPILGRSILGRGEDYQRNTLFRGLKALFFDSAWKDFYEEYDICVKTFGRPEFLVGTYCEPCLEWISSVCEATIDHTTCSLFYGIGGSPVVGEDAAWNALQFLQQHKRVPTLLEQVKAYYGVALPPADFFIMTSKMSGMGALPNLLINGDTEVYFLPTMMGLNEFTYRSILFDMLFNRYHLRTGIADFNATAENRIALRHEYEKLHDEVLGLGFNIGNIWVMEKRD